MGRFTQEDTHWNPGNMVYGGEPQKWNEYRSWAKNDEDKKDPLGLHAYTYKPEATAVAQAGNLYAYGLNNPIYFVDRNGEIGIIATLLIGAGVGALINGGFQIYNNLKTGQKWTNGLLRATVAGAVSGAISVIPIPGVNSWVAVAITGATGNLVGKVIMGEIKSGQDVISALAAGGAAGIIGEATARLVSKGFQSYFATLTKSQQKAFLSRIGNISNRELTAVRQSLKSAGTSAQVQKAFEKYGYDMVISAFVSSTTASTAP